MAQAQRLTDPHPGLGQQREQEPVPQTASHAARITVTSSTRQGGREAAAAPAA